MARFQTLCNSYASGGTKGGKYEGQPELVTLFSGDAFNPSLESGVTKGSLCSFLFLVVRDGVGFEWRVDGLLIMVHRQSHGSIFERYWD